MISKKIADFAATVSFTPKDDSAYGFIDGLLFSVYETGSKKSFFVYFSLSEISADDESPVSIMTVSSSLQETFAKYNVTEYSFKEDGLEVICVLPFKDFYSLMKDTAKKLSQFKAIRKDICCACHEQIKDGQRFRISKEFKNRILCSACKNELDTNCSESEIEESSEEPNNHSTLKGISGAILLGLGVSICLILLYAFAIPLPDAESSFKPGYYVNWISAFIPIAAIFGYKIFSKEDINNKMILINGGISIVLALVSQYVSSVILFSRESIMTFENLTSGRFFKMLPSLLKIPFTDSFVSPDFKIYVLMDAIFVVVALLVISFFTAPKTEPETIIEEL